MAERGETAARHEIVEIPATDGHAIRVNVWSGAAPLAVILVFHGLAEHAGRYARFARRAVARGHAVVAHDHRGHGAGATRLGHFADRDGWNKVLGDAALVRDRVRQRFGDAPLLLFGHSMGSYLAQSFVMRDAGDLSRLVLSGSTWPPRFRVRLGRVAARLEMLHAGRRHRSALLDGMGFGEFNQRFAPARTPFDWLTRDESEVDRYIADPLCGAVSSTALWHDLLGGLLEIGTDEALHKVPAALPILITGGERDPVGGKPGMQRLAAAYQRTGHTAVTLRTYQGARHEMLNEINRDAFTTDLLRWIDRARGPHR